MDLEHPHPLLHHHQNLITFNEYSHHDDDYYANW